MEQRVVSMVGREAHVQRAGVGSVQLKRQLCETCQIKNTEHTARMKTAVIRRLPTCVPFGQGLLTTTGHH